VWLQKGVGRVSKESLNGKKGVCILRPKGIALDDKKNRQIYCKQKFFIGNKTKKKSAMREGFSISGKERGSK